MATYDRSQYVLSKPMPWVRICRLGMVEFVVEFDATVVFIAVAFAGVQYTTQERQIFWTHKQSD